MNYIPPPQELRRGSSVDVYLRDSGGEGQERSVESQLAEVREYCKAHHLILRKIWTDEARSGRGMIGRQNFDAMIEAYKTERDNPTGLLIWDYARFARNTKDAIYAISTIEHHNVIIHSLIDYIPDGAFRELGRAIKHMGNQAESEKNSAAVKRMQHQLVKNNKAMFGTPPRGFMRSPLPPIRNERTGELRSLNQWVPDATIAPLVLRAYQMRAEGATISDIHKATGLYKNIACYTTFFPNKLYKGTLEFGTLTIENYCEPIVPPELWDRVNQLRRTTKPGAKTKDPRRIKSRYLLSGLIHCQQCGAALVGHQIKNWSYYICPTRKASRTCTASHIPKEKIERSILHTIEETFTLERIIHLQGQISEYLKRDQLEAQAARLKLDREAATLTKKIANLTEAVAKHGHSESLINALETYETEHARIKSQIKQLETDINIPRHKTPELKAIADELKRITTTGTFEEQQTLIRTIVTRIIASRTNGETRAMLYHMPIKILTRHQSGLGVQVVPPRGVWAEEQLTVIEL